MGWFIVGIFFVDDDCVFGSFVNGYIVVLFVFVSVSFQPVTCQLSLPLPLETIPLILDNQPINLPPLLLQLSLQDSDPLNKPFLAYLPLNPNPPQLVFKRNRLSNKFLLLTAVLIPTLI